MKKLNILVLCFVLLATLTACGAVKAPDTSLDSIMTEIVEKCSISNEIILEKSDLLDYYGIKTDDVAEIGACITMNGIFPDEIIMVKAADSDAAGRIQKCLETRLNEVMNQSKNYDADSYAVAQKCKVDVKGEYVALFVSSQHEEMTKLYNAHF